MTVKTGLRHDQNHKMGQNQASLRKKLADKPTVVIVGAGYGGVEAAKKLDNHLNVVLIDRKDYFIHNNAAMRACVQPGFQDQILMPYSNLLKNGYVIHAEVSEINATGITIHGREEPLLFDYLIIATGTSYAFPCKVALPNNADATALYTEFQDAVRRSQRILVVGGGPVGCEMVGEIREVYSEKQITLLHSRDVLVPGPFLPAFHERLLGNMGELNIEVILGDRVLIPKEGTDAKEEEGEAKVGESAIDTEGLEEPKPLLDYVEGERTWSTRSGRCLTADLTVFCIGSSLNTGSFKETLAASIDTNGRLKVNEWMQVLT
jgi:NADH dehydrogenase FAD-containing subunit